MGECKILNQKPIKIEECNIKTFKIEQFQNIM